MDPYVVLGLDPDCVDEDITKAYRKAALKCHPDVGGDPAKFAELACAVSILRDPHKRKLFDDFGVCMDATESYIEKKVNDLFESLVSSWIMRQLQHDRDISITKYFSGKLRDASDSLGNTITKVEKRIIKLKRRKTMVLGPSGKNVVVAMINGMIDSSQRELKAAEEEKYIISLVKTMSEEYSSVEETEPKPTMEPHGGIFSSFATTSSRHNSSFTKEHMEEMLKSLYRSTGA